MPSNVVAMPLPVRWYRNRRRCLLLYGLPALAPLVLAAYLILAESSLVWTVLGALAVVVAIWLLAGAALAGLGVSRDAVIIRSPLLTQHRVPWSEVTKFDVVQHGENGESVVVVTCADGRRLHTGGCTFPGGPDGHSRAEAMAYGLKTDMLARSGADLDAKPARRVRRGLGIPGVASPGWLTARRAHSGHLVASIVISVVILGVAGLLLFGGISALGPALRASHGQGVRGAFVAENQYCGRYSCHWDGNFVLPDGAVYLSGVGFNGGTSGMSAGQSVPALYSGDPSLVFATHDSTQWLGQVVQIIFGVITFAISASLIVRQARRARGMGNFHSALLSGAS